ncbi:MAG: arylsulfatase [Rhodoblastus sp.]|nr:MAG: arylsulfatase [Rhodoblastus sp.]
MAPRIALIHALRHSPPPIEAAFAQLWPQARLMNLLDDSLSTDLQRAGALDDAMTGRFLRLGRYAARSGANAILFTCSAFAPCIDAVKADLPELPVLKPYEAMIEEAAEHGSRIALIASFAQALTSMPPEFPPTLRVTPLFAPGALAALDLGDGAAHDRLVAEAASGLKGQDAVALAQFSLARAAAAVAAVSGLPVLTTPHSAVRKLKRIFRS